ncbi:hypothetical protein N8T08_003035 [Aspergillus melleus]|uniref:Uncharacterized protein n=1 Tax=Aspergillus melleus TaxID=138277 RepID=A0ACC3ALL7_9EURO|nr:hypothetical protein N8T08_003035 [Aspergillus melleus]
MGLDALILRDLALHNRPQTTPIVTSTPTILPRVYRQLRDQKFADVISFRRFGVVPFNFMIASNPSAALGPGGLLSLFFFCNQVIMTDERCYDLWIMR